MRFKYFETLILVFFASVVASCAIDLEFNPESSLKVWKDYPYPLDDVLPMLKRSGFEVTEVSDRLQILTNDRGCEINLYFDESRKLISYERMSKKDVCLYKDRVAF